MPSHRRGKSLSEALTLEQSDEGVLVVSSDLANQGLREGDEILGATINFEQLSKEEVLHVLKLMEPFNDKVQVLTKNNRSKSLGNLDQYAKTPETMLTDSYSKLYNSKIKKFLRSDLLGEDHAVSGEGAGEPPTPVSSKVNLKHDTSLPVLGVDFGLLKMKPLNSNVDDAGDFTYGSNLNLPPMGSVGTALIGAPVSRLNVDARSSQLNAPDFDGTKKELKVPKVKVPNVDLSGPSFGAPEYEVNRPDVGTPDAPSGKPSIKYSKRLKNPDLNVDNPSSNAELPKLRLSGRSPDVDLDMPGVNASQLDLNGPNADLPFDKFTQPSLGVSGKSDTHFETPDLTFERPTAKRRVSAPKADLKGPHLSSDMQSVAIKGSSGKYQPPKFTMPKFDLPDIQVNKNVDLNRPSAGLDIPNPNAKLRKTDFVVPGPKVKDPKYEFKNPGMEVSPPKLKGDVSLTGVDLKERIPDLNRSNADINIPSGKIDLDADAPSGKFRLPKFKLFGTLPKKKGVDVNAEVEAPEIAMNSPEINDMDVPDLRVRNMKVKRPDLHLSSTLPKGSNLDVNTDLKSPDFNLKAPEIKGGFDAPDVTFPNMDLKAPWLDVHSPKVNTGSPKMNLRMPKLKKPKFGVPGLKGPEIDDNFSGPDVDINAPRINLEMPDVDVAAQSGKFRNPNLNLPDLGLSVPVSDGPSLNGKSPDLDFSGPNLSGDINSPGIILPKVDYKSPKIDISKPKLDVDMPSGKLKMPEIHAPGWDIKAPSGKFPNVNLSGILPKGPNLDVNSQIKSPDFNLKAPELKGGIDTPEVDLPKMDLRAPNLEVNPPDVTIDLPKAKLRTPKVKMPKFDPPSLKVPQIDGNFGGPDMDIAAPNLSFRGPKSDLEMPRVDVAGPSRKFKIPNLNLPDMRLSDPNLDGPNLDFKSPNISAPNLGSGINAPDINLPKVDLVRPKLDLKAPKLDADLSSGQLKMPKLHGPDWEVHAPSSKFKLPKFSGSSTLPKGPILDLNPDLKSPDLNLNSPDIKGGIDAPDLDLPNVDLKSPKLDMNSPNVNIGSPKAKFKMPKLKFRKFSLPGLKDPEIDGPNLDLKSPDLNISSPNLSGGINTPEINTPKVDLKTPDMDLSNVVLDKPPKIDGKIGSPKGKLKMPKLKIPKFSLPNFKGPEIDGKFSRPDLDRNAPTVNLNGPKADLDIDRPSGKFKKPNFKLPDLRISGAELDGPNLDLKSTDISGPNLSGGIKAPKINMPDVNFKTPKLDLNSPKLDLDMPSLTKPKADLHTPDLNVKAPSGKLKFPDFNLSGTLPKGPKMDLNADVNLPDFNLKSPKIKGSLDSPDMNLPDMGLKAPKLDLGTPDANIRSPKTKLKMPKFNLPNLKGPEIDGNFDGPDINMDAPSISLKGSKPGFDIPAVDLGSNIGGGIKAPKINMPNIDLKAPKLDLNSQKLDLDMPSLTKPKADLHTPDLNVKAPSGKLKFPDFSLSGTLPKGPKMDLNADVNSPDFNLKSPKIKGSFDSPDMDLPDMGLKAPKLDLGTPDANIRSPKTKLKMPKLKMPKFNLPNLKGPEIDGNFDGPDINMDAPSMSLKGSKPAFDIPDVDLGSTLGKPKKPLLKIPDIGFTSPDLDGPNFDFGTPNLKAEYPTGPKGDINLDLKNPDIHLKGPKGEMKSRINTPMLDLPKMGYKAPKLDMNAPDVNLGLPDAKMKKPKIKMPKGPSVAINGDLEPELNAPNVDVRGPRGKVKMAGANVSGPHAKPPQMNFSGPKLKGPAINMPEVNLPDSGFKGPKLDLNSKHPDLGINGHIGQHDMNFSAPKVKGGISGPDFVSNVPSGNIQVPQSDLDSNHNRKFKLPSFKLPQFGGPDFNRTGSDIDFGAPLPRANISPPNAKLSAKPPEMKIITGPNISAPNIDLKMPKVTTQNPQLHLKPPDLNIDDPSLNLQGPSFKNRRSDLTGVKTKTPPLDIDGDVRHSKKSSTVDIRSSYPPVDSHYIDFIRSDLNIDDFTEKDHVLRARGSKKALQVSHNHGDAISPSNVHIGTNDPTQVRGENVIYAKPQKKRKTVTNAQLQHSAKDSGIRVPDSTDGYYVTVFPDKIQNQKPLNHKSSALGGPEFYTTNVDLEVPNENDLKGSTLFFSNLM